MTAKEGDRPPDGTSGERLSLEEIKRLVEEARKRGEDPGPFIRRLVLQTIEDVRAGLDGADRESGS